MASVVSWTPHRFFLAAMSRMRRSSVPIAVSNMQLSTCLNGRWSNGICVCNQGYRTATNSLAPAPEYCTDVTIIKIGTTMTTKDALHLAAMTVTVSVACFVLVALATFVYKVLNSIRIAARVAAARQSYKCVQIELAANTRVLLNAKVWVPAHPYVCANRLKDNDDNRAYVIHNFVPQTQCELYLKKGDVITEIEVLKDGWCKGKLNGVLGFFPLSYVKMTNRRTESTIQ